MAEYTKPSYQNFSYFDQFKDIEIDLSRYLKNFSTDEYQLKFSNLQPVKVTVKNLFEQYRILDRYKRDASSFIKYTIKDNERVENISYKFYDTPDFWWIILVFNNIKNPFYEMPLAEDQLIQFSRILSIREGKYPQNVYYKLINETNEHRRNIIIPRTAILSDVIWEFREAILQEKIKVS